MKKNILYIFTLIGFSAFSQDTFSIVAADSITGEVGSAGASCVDLFTTGLPNDDFLSELFPGVGGINSQAAYLPANQATARDRMNAGDTPDEIVAYMIANDAQSTPQTRQYGVVRLVTGSPQTAAHTGASCLSYANHIVGPNYTIQGNILLSQVVLDAMEAGFNNTIGDLKCKLMGALQGAKMVGADSRCASNGTSSLFAFIKVMQPTDTFGNPSFLLSVRTHNGDEIEPIDSLRTLFNQTTNSCDFVGQTEFEMKSIKIFPNPATNQLFIESIGNEIPLQYTLTTISGKVVLSGSVSSSIQPIEIEQLTGGTYLLKVTSQQTNQVQKIVID